MTRKLILEYKGLFSIPEQVLQEINKYRRYLERKSGLFPGEFDALLAMLLQKCKVMPNSQLVAVQAYAQQLVSNIDPNDMLFVACCLALPNSALWSDDKRLRSIREINVITTQEMASSKPTSKSI